MINVDKVVFLIQSDTTVGLLSRDIQRLAKIKKRDPKQPFLKSISSFRELKEDVRVSKKYKKLVRRANKSTFIYPNKKALRVVKTEPHHSFLKRFGWFYSTSANETKKDFDFNYIKDKVDIIVEDANGFYQTNSSKLYILGKTKARRIR